MKTTVGDVIVNDVKKLLVSVVLVLALAGHASIALSGVDVSAETKRPVKRPTRMSFLHTIILAMESSGRRYDANGNLLTSHRGAMGEMQVMPLTVSDPGYGVTPAADNSPEEYARVGREYFNALLKEYEGDIGKAFAAYNAGPLRVNNAMVRAERNGKPDQWLVYLPRETRRYVRNGLQQVHMKTQRTDVQMASAL